VGGFSFLREADWLDGGRVRVYAALIGIASLALVGVSWVQAMVPPGSDYLAFWGAAKAVLAGTPQAAYDLAFEHQVQAAAGFPASFAFVNPPPFLFVAAPFGWLSYGSAWLAWVVATYAIWAWTSVKAFPRLWLLVLAYPGALIAAGHAQNGFVTGALLVGAVMLLDRRPFVAGALLGALIVKPHLALLIPFWLAGGRRWRAFAAAVASAFALLALSWLAFGSATMLAYTESWQASAAIMRAADRDLLLRMSTLYAQVRLYAGETAAIAVDAPLDLALAALAAASWHRMGRDAMASGSLTLAATALASPYLFNYDLPFLVLPTLWLVREGLREGFRPWEKALLVALWFAPYATRAMALPLGLNLMPFAAVLLLWLVWRRGSGSPEASAPQTA
jgi:hypothetical protein